MAEALPCLVDNYTLFQLKGAPNEGQEMWPDYRGLKDFYRVRYSFVDLNYAVKLNMVIVGGKSVRKLEPQIGNFH